MSVVPDLFSRPDSGVVVGLTGVDLDNMPTLNSLMNTDASTENNDDRVVGHMEVPGKHCNHMMKNVNNQKDSSAVEPSAIVSSFKTQAHQSGISGMKVDVTSANAADVDAQIAALMNDSSLAEDGKTVILHIVIEEEDGAARRRLLARRLEEAEGEEAQDGNANNNADADGGDANNQQQQSNNGFYGYGYYNAYGEWVTPYKTMFQIQYFNVVLWTAVGLVVVLFFSIYLMVYMPLMVDTLLFGESAKMSLDD
jgi:hypothetical protein